MKTIHERQEAIKKQNLIDNITDRQIEEAEAQEREAEIKRRQRGKKF